MEVHAITKYARVSPTKAVAIVNLLPGKSVNEAIAMMSLEPSKSARIILKTLSSALANAENNLGLKRNNLYVKSALVTPGPMYKRYRPKARGMAGRIRKRTSHFTVILTDELK
ncbi:MAG TPA: 50S ribosomal protein L22 [Victivallales bacterium]|nr:50S ribosomal protein L22 [Victivallales bacterium]HRU00818.1 50S ribosomal protein L22 [Victivallales bacterium]